MLKTRIMKVKSIENQEMMMVITMKKIIIKTVIMTITKIIMMVIRIKIGNRINIKTLKQNKNYIVRSKYIFVDNIRIKK